MTEYRKAQDSDTWHFCKNCSQWPTTGIDVERRYVRPTTGEFCEECKAKARENDCK